jgi:hypothetical protein
MGGGAPSTDHPARSSPVSFIAEQIPQQYLETFDFSIFTDMYGRRVPPKPGPNRSWVRDADRNAFLLVTGAGEDIGGPRDFFFAFWWNGAIAQFLLQEERKRTPEGCELIWRDRWGRPHAINLKPELEPRRPEIMAMIKEALVAEGTQLSTDPRRRVSVQFEF